MNLHITVLPDSMVQQFGSCKFKSMSEEDLVGKDLVREIQFFNPNQTGGGGGGWNPSLPLDVSRDNFVEFFPAHRAFATFFFRVLRNFDAIFVKIGRTVPKLRNVM